MLIKGLDIGFKDIDLKKGIVKGQFCSHGNKDLGGDISIFGSLAKTMQERGPKGKKLIKFCLNHWTTGLPGVLDELWEEQSGGFYAAKAGIHDAGQNFLKMVESEIINQHSYGYKEIKSEYDAAQKANILKELYLYEVSAIEFLGMNENTTYIEMKSMDDALAYMDRLEKFIRTSDATDDLLSQLETKFNSLLKLVKPSPDTSKQKEAEIFNSLLTTLEISWKN